jgi:hypothetical protein
MNLIKLSEIYFFDTTSKISLHNGHTEIGDDQFLAVGLEKSKAAKNWEDTDYFNIIIVTRAYDQKYYILKIEHPADVLSPKYVEDEMRIMWVEETIKPTDKELIGNLYSLNDSRCHYTLTIREKPYFFYEKYICYTFSVSYDIWENYEKTKIEASPYFQVRCKLSSYHCASDVDDSPTNILEYPIAINSLLQTSVFQYRPFEIWDGNVIIDGVRFVPSEIGLKVI